MKFLLLNINWCKQLSNPPIRLVLYVWCQGILTNQFLSQISGYFDILRCCNKYVGRYYIQRASHCIACTADIVDDSLCDCDIQALNIYHDCFVCTKEINDGLCLICLLWFNYKYFTTVAEI